MASRDSDDFDSAASSPSGVLLIQTGTPQAPTKSALRSYLAEFLSDPRVIEWPRWLWLPLLHGIILRVRPGRVAPKYEKIWTERGSPLLITLRDIASKLERLLQDQLDFPVQVSVGMRYGQPSIQDGLRELRAMGIWRIMVLPLFPQYSAVTTASAYDAVFAELRTWRRLPEVHAIMTYHNHPAYIHALTTSICELWDQHGQPDRLLFSYHGIPKSYSERGDPYVDMCLETTRLVAEKLGTQPVGVQTAFQSRFGREEWSQPYTDDVLQEWGRNGVENAHVICPGFSVDCLETMHEIAVEGREIFHRAGGKGFHHIPALNDSAAHIQSLAAIVSPHIGDFDFHKARQASIQTGG